MDTVGKEWESEETRRGMVAEPVTIRHEQQITSMSSQ